MRNTKIVATLGPSSRSPEMVRALFAAGVDVFRINASHGNHAAHGKVIAEVRALSQEGGRSPGILLDLQGPKIRLGAFEGGQATLTEGERFTITVEPIVGTAAIASTTYPGLAKDVAPGDRVLLADGSVELRVLETNGTSAVFDVISGGVVRDNQGINLPGVRVNLPSMTEKDCADLEFGVAQHVDMVALSFVRTGADVESLRKKLKALGSRLPIIAKIEKPEALDHLDEILDAADGVMVARGDLGVELALTRVPGAQKTIIERARYRGKFVITATQMLESMIEKPTPTRAEVNDVANAIFDGTDAVMLSAETANGQHPLESVRMMAAIATEAESFLGHRAFPEPPLGGQPTHAEIVAETAYHSGLSAGVKAIAVFTAWGEMVRLIARFRPRVPIFAFCETATAARELSVIYGAHPVVPVKVSSIEDMMEACNQKMLSEGWWTRGDSVILVTGGANILKLHHLGETGMRIAKEDG